jgi:hypothetical protein
MQLIAQTIGFIAFALGVTAFFQKEDRRLRLFLFVQGTALSLHFILMGAHTGAILALLAGSRAGVTLFAWGKKLAPVYYIATIIVVVLTYESPVDLLPAIAGFLGITALFYLQGLTMRLAFLTGGVAWLTHNILVGSIGPSLMEAFMMSTISYRIYHMIREHKKRPDGKLPPGVI